MTGNDTFIASIRLAQSGHSDECGKILNQNSALIWSVAKHFFGRGAEPDDLFQIGCIGMMKAILSYDFSFGTKLSTYAVPKIAGEIRRFLRDDGMIKVSRSIKEASIAIVRAREQISSKTGHEVKISEISEYTGLSPEEIACCESAAGSVISLSSETDQTGLSLENIIGINGIEDEILEKVTLSDAVAKLDIIEQKVIRLRFYKAQTQQQTARILKISQVQVSRIEKRAIKKLKIIYSDK